MPLILSALFRPIMLFCLLTGSVSAAFAQNQGADSTGASAAGATTSRRGRAVPPPRAAWLIMPTAGVFHPEGRLAERYGAFGEVGAQVFFKTAKNWFFGVEGTYFFGGAVQEDVLARLRTEEGEIITPQGNFADIAVNQRGLRLPVFKVGRSWRPGLMGPRAENGSGFIAMLGAGYMAHYLLINDYSRVVPQLQGEYVKGYDRLTSGPMISQSLGFIYLDRGRTWNFYIGVEAWQGFTQGRRYDFDLGRQDKSTRIDAAFGLKASWILPLYRNNENDEFWD